MLGLDYSTVIWLLAIAAILIFITVVAEEFGMATIFFGIFMFLIIEASTIDSDIEKLLLQHEKLKTAIKIEKCTIEEAGIKIKSFTHRGLTIKYFIRGEIIMIVRDM